MKDLVQIRQRPNYPTDPLLANRTYSEMAFNIYDACPKTSDTFGDIWFVLVGRLMGGAVMMGGCCQIFGPLRLDEAEIKGATHMYSLYGNGGGHCYELNRCPSAGSLFLVFCKIIGIVAGRMSE